jgi:hypothetical protein
VARKYTKEVLENAVRSSKSWAATLRYLKLQDSGGNRSNLQRNVKDFGIDTSHFTGQGHLKGVPSPRKRHYSEYLVLRPEGSSRLTTDTLRRAMLDYGFEYKCCFSDCPTHNGWINGPIGFEIDHINGNNIDNRSENLRFICAICHAQQPTSSHSWDKADRYGTSSVCECGGRKRYSSKRCLDCHHRFVASNKKTRPVSKPTCIGPRKRKSFPRKSKIAWPEVDNLEKMVLESNYSEVARKLGVSDNAVRKRLRTRSS